MSRLFQVDEISFQFGLSKKCHNNQINRHYNQRAYYTRIQLKQNLDKRVNVKFMISFFGLFILLLVLE